MNCECLMTGNEFKIHNSSIKKLLNFNAYLKGESAMNVCTNFIICETCTPNVFKCKLYVCELCHLKQLLKRKTHYNLCF